MSNPYVGAALAGAKRTIHRPSMLLSGVIVYGAILVVFSALWRGATERQDLSGYSYFELMWYFIGAETAVISTFSRIMDTTADDIISGSIETEMIRPASVVGLRIADEVGASWVRMLTIGGAGWLMGLLLADGFPPLHNFALGVLAAVLGIVANVAGMHAFISATFWLREARSSWFVYQKLLFLLGGMMLPLQVFPQALQGIIWSMPFWSMAYAPGRLMSGAVEPLLLIGQLGWIAVLLALAMRTFALGERHIARYGS